MRATTCVGVSPRLLRRSFSPANASSSLVAKPSHYPEVLLGRRWSTFVFFVRGWTLSLLMAPFISVLLPRSSGVLLEGILDFSFFSIFSRVCYVFDLSDLGFVFRVFWLIVCGLLGCYWFINFLNGQSSMIIKSLGLWVFDLNVVWNENLIILFGLKYHFFI